MMIESLGISIRLPRPLSIGLVTVVLTVVAVGLRIGIPIYRQQVAVQEIERLGGWVFTEPRGPEWLWSLLYRIDADLGARTDIVNSVCLRHLAATDNTLYHMGCLSDLRELELTDTQVTDTGLAHLKWLTRLERIDLSHAPVTDAGVAELQRALPRVTIRR
jgi:hypothetical protein